MTFVTLFLTVWLAATAWAIDPISLPLHRHRSNRPSMHPSSKHLSSRAPVNELLSNWIYSVEVSFGSRHYQLALDLTQSDTWIVTKDCVCTYNDVPSSCSSLSTCNFADGLPPPASAKSSTVYYYNAPTLNQAAGTVAGVFVWEDITISGLTIKNQAMALVNETNFGPWDGFTSGVLGLAFAGLNTAYTGGIFNSAFPPGTNQPYTPFAQKLSSFALALSRGATNAGPEIEGTLTLNGLPPVPYNTTLSVSPILGGPGPLTYYNIHVDGFSVDGAYRAAPISVTLDLDESYIALPGDIVVAYANKIDPADKSYDPIYGTWSVRAGTVLPPFAIEIGGQSFPIKPADLLLCENLEAGNLCPLALVNGDWWSVGRAWGPYSLGTAFFNNVMAEFDIKNKAMRFGSRELY